MSAAGAMASSPAWTRATAPERRDGQLLWESSYAAGTTGGTVLAEPTHTGCFLAGTRILTQSGAGLVHALRVGDAVVTGAGLRRQIKWIGRRTYSAETMAANPHLRPVLLRAGSLGADRTGAAVPHRDLFLAPMHAVVIEDGEAGAVLVPAAALVNGASILRPAPGAAVHYVHLELNSHDLVIAEGAAAETFIDCGNRPMFQNAAEFAALYPRHAAASWGFCMPRLEEGQALERIRRRLAALAGVNFVPPRESRLRFTLERRRGVLEGWALDEAAPDIAVELDILLNGERFARLPANRYRPDLDHAGLANGRCGFTCPLPARGGHIAIRHVPAAVAETEEAA
jgi:hypothetical protein